MSTQTQPQTLKAAAWMCGTLLSFSVMAIGGREVSGVLDTFEIMFFRSCIGIVVVLGIAYLAGTLSEIRTTRLPLHAARNLMHFTGQNLWFYALPLIPLAQVFAIEFSTPIWVAIMAPLFLGERFTRIRIFAIFLGFVGVLIVTRPGMLEIGPGVITAALSAIAFAATAIFTKRLTRVESITSILTWLTVMQAIFGAICVFWDGQVTWPPMTLWPFVVLIGLSGLSAHFCLTRALSLAPATIVTPIDFMRLPLIAVVGAVFYLEPFDPLVLVGAAVIFAANYLNIRSEMRARR